MGRIIFVTGTDTGVGKTVLTSLLLAHLVEHGESVFPLKLFCSGDRSDAEIFHKITGGKFALDEINPWFFPEPATPLIAARKAGVQIKSEEALRKIEKAQERCAILLSEGAGGLLSPLGEGFNALDLITATGAEVIVVAPNKLGTLNHCCLTIRELHRAGALKIKLVLMDQEHPDLSAQSNCALLEELLNPIKPIQMPWLNPDVLVSIRTGSSPMLASLEAPLAFLLQV